MNNIFFDFIIDYAKHRKSPFDSEYEILIFELQALCGSDLSINQIAIIKKRKTNPYLKNLFQNILKIIIKMKNILKIQ